MKTSISPRSRLLLTSAIVVAVAGVGIYSSQSTGASPAQAAAPIAVPVVVRTLAEQKIRGWSEFSGRLHAVDAAEIRPEVSGRIVAVKFEDGQNVKAGDVLFVIDPRPYEAAVAKAEADLASAKTNASFARLELDRAKGLRESQAIAQRVYDERANSARVADASVQGAEATLKQASLDLEHAYVRAPIAGRASRAEITLGNLVQAGPGAPLLTTVVANKSIYADFDVDEQTYVKNVRDYANGRDQERRIPVELSVQDDREHVYKGTIDSFDNRLDPASGTIRARAKFDNTDQALVPGMFVSVRLASGGESNEVLIPARALGFDQSKKFVYVVGDGNKVAYREVELGQQIASDRVALKGVRAGDRVIVDGIQHVRPDIVVAPQEMASATPPAQAAAK